MLTYKMGEPRLLKPKELKREGSVQRLYESDFDEFLTSSVVLENPSKDGNAVSEDICFEFPGIGIVVEGGGVSYCSEKDAEGSQEIKTGDVFYIIPSKKISLSSKEKLVIYFCSCK